MENLPAAGNAAVPPGPQLSPGVIFKQIMQQRESALAERQQDSALPGDGGLPGPPDAASNGSGHRTGLPLAPRDVEQQQQQQQPPSSSPCSPLQPIQGAAATNSLPAFPGASPLPPRPVPQQSPKQEEDRAVMPVMMDLRSPSPKPQSKAPVVPGGAPETDDLIIISSDDEQEAAALVVGEKRKDPEPAVVFVSHIPAPQPPAAPASRLLQQQHSTAYPAPGGAPLPHPYSQPMGAPGFAAADAQLQQQQLQHQQLQHQQLQYQQQLMLHQQQLHQQQHQQQLHQQQQLHVGNPGLLLRQQQPNSQPMGAAAVVPGAAAPLGSSNSSTAESKRALRAVAEALTSTSAVEREPPHGALRCTTMPHQRLALGWMCKREEGCIPVGGILADDQGLGKTISTISLIVTRPPNRTRPPGAVAGGAGPSARGPRPDSSSGPASASTAASANGKLASEAPAAASAAAAAAEGAHEQGAAGALVVQEALEEEVLNLFAASDSDSDEMDVVDVTDECVGSGQQGRRPEAGTLVVCPTAVLNQWASEIEDKVDSAAGLTVTIYHGKDKIRDPEVLSRMGVVLTTYTTMALEAPAKIRQKGKQAAMSPSELRNRGEEGGPLFRCYWHRVVLDEGHSIKNSRTVVAKAAWHLAARNRWILTGTPLQNSVDDLYSYFRFLRYTPYTDHAAFKRQIKDPISQRPAVGYKRLNAVLKGVMLRRTKSTTINGKPVVDLPPCTLKLVRKRFSPQEQQLYNKIHSECTNKFNAMKAASGGKTNYVNMLLMLLRLRQACNHPGLVKDSTGGTVALHPPTAAQVAAARELPEALRKELMAAGLECASQCPICDDIPEDAVVSSVCKHVYCRTCIVTKMQEPEWENRPQCPCCSAVLKGEASVHSPAALMEAEAGGQGAVPGAPALQIGGGPPLPEESNAISSAKVEQLMEILKKIRDSQAPPEASGSSSSVHCRARLPSLGRGKRDKRMAAAFGRLSRTAAASHAPQAAPRQKSPPPSGSGSPPPGCKIPDKVLVFSQWTSMLDLLEGPIREAGIEFRRLDGTMSVAQRQDAVTDFKNNPKVFVLIASLKAAAVGLNLVAANYVVLLDLWWNPTIEQQAIDRAHRIGQTREVEVVRITIEGTVEDRILSLQGKKKEIVDAALDEGGAGGQGDRHSASRLSQHDLEYLFLGNHS